MRRICVGLVCAGLTLGCADDPQGAGSTGSSGEVTTTATPPASTAPSPGSDASGDASTGSTTTAADSTEGRPTNSPPQILVPEQVAIAEREDWSLVIEVSDADGDDVRVFPLGLPPGALWDEDARTLSFRPDFTQGAVASSWEVVLVADDGQAKVEAAMTLTVDDTIQPPLPQVVSTEPGDGFTWQYIAQTTDDFLDAPGYAGRSYDAVVARPDDVPEGELRPVLVLLHGFGGTPPMSGWEGEYRIMPHDPDNTYWWGYSDALPGADASRGDAVPPYTQRRVMHLLEWVLRNEPGADPERVFIQGSSMGGAGAATIGLMWARHFSGIDADIFQVIPRSHRPSRVEQLSQLWGSPAAGLVDDTGMAVWDRMDLTRVLQDDPLARDQWIGLRHGKDDPTIHFGAVMSPSPTTGQAAYEALQGAGVGHQAVWDEGAHGPADPVMGSGWWQAGWNPNFDTTAYTRRSLALPAFSRASHDGDPGTGEGNGLQPWSDESGFAGDVNVPGDTGWDGETAGALNRFLRWDATGIVDELDRFECPLRFVDGDGGPPPQRGYPTTGDRFDGRGPATADVSLRRVQAFRCRPGEVVDWTFGDAAGEATADAQGRLTIPGLEITVDWQTLVVVRR